MAKIRQTTKKKHHYLFCGIDGHDPSFTEVYTTGTPVDAYEQVTGEKRVLYEESPGVWVADEVSEETIVDLEHPTARDRYFDIFLEHILSEHGA